MHKLRDVRDRRGWAFGFMAGWVKPTFRALTDCVWIDGEKIPEQGGCVLAPNHLSHIDPLVIGLYVYDHGRLVRYLAKQEVFETPVLRTIARDAGQIPVRRLTHGAASAFEAACEGVDRGEVVAIYPEGTITRDPDLWPMRGKTGAARVGLTTGAPVIPIGQWGAQDVLYPYAKRPDLLPRKTIRVKAGDPVDLDDLRGRPLTNEVLHEATERILDAITAIVADLRGEEPPAQRLDPKAAGVREIGNPHKDRRRKR